MTGANESDTSAHLWDGWTDWAEDHHEFVGTQRRFGDRLEDKGYKRRRIEKATTGMPAAPWILANDSGAPRGTAQPRQAPDASDRLRPAAPRWYDRRRHPL